MKSITIHDLDDKMDWMIRQRAKSLGLSLNRTIKKLLAKALGIEGTPQEDHSDEFMDLFGVWSEEDFVEFEAATGDFEKIDPGDWQ
jgi:hypothetical protein